MVEEPQRTRPGGLAIEAAMQAKRFGHRGVPIARVGQDRAADQIMQLLREEDVDATHLQSDPDRATGRIVVRSLAGREQTKLDPAAAFDNLQWDFDLLDVAQEADGVIFGQLCNRSTQTRSVIQQLLSECANAVRCFDLTHRAPGQMIVRHELASLLAISEVVILDDAAMRALFPGAAAPKESADRPGGAVDDAAAGMPGESGLSGAWRSAARTMRRQGALALLVRAEAGEPFELHDAEAGAIGAQAFDPARRHAFSIALMHGLLAGWSTQEIARLLARMLDPAHAQDIEVPDAWRENSG